MIVFVFSFEHPNGSDASLGLHLHFTLNSYLFYCVLLTCVDGKDDYESMIECIMEGCNDVSVTNQEDMGGQQSFPRKKRDFSELQSSCQARHSIYLLVFVFEFFMTKLNLDFLYSNIVLREIC